MERTRTHLAGAGVAGAGLAGAGTAVLDRPPAAPPLPTQQTRRREVAGEWSTGLYRGTTGQGSYVSVLVHAGVMTGAFEEGFALDQARWGWGTGVHHDVARDGRAYVAFAHHLAGCTAPVEAGRHGGCSPAYLAVTEDGDHYLSVDGRGLAHTFRAPRCRDDVGAIREAIRRTGREASRLAYLGHRTVAGSGVTRGGVLAPLVRAGSPRPH